MQIIEHRTTGKKSQEENEDGMVVTDSFVAVIDGSTSKTPIQLSPQMKNGRYAMRLIGEHIAKHLPPEASCDDFCQTITEVFRAEYRRHGLDLRQLEIHPEQRITASVAVYSCHRREVWMVGDCQCLVGGRLYENNKPAEAVNALKRSRYILAAMEAGKPAADFMLHDDGRDHIINDIIRSCEGQNRQYAVVDGFPVLRKGVITIPVAAGTEVILATDGYPELHSTLEASERALQQLLKEDPLCIGRYKATKGLMSGNVSFDDRTYIRFTA